MSRKRQGERPNPPPAEAPPAMESCPAPPQKRPWQLAISCALMLAWILFVAAMAWR